MNDSKCLIATDLFRLHGSASPLSFVRRNRYDGAHRWEVPFMAVPSALFCPIFNCVLFESAIDFDDAAYDDRRLGNLLKDRSFAAPMPRLRVLLDERFKSDLQARLREPKPTGGLAVPPQSSRHSLSKPTRGTSPRTEDGSHA